MKGVLLVGIGGFVGSVCRYLVGEYTLKNFASVLPLGTLSVNLLGSLIIGILAGWFMKTGPQPSQLLLATGFCGGFTTFSTFSLDGLMLLKGSQYGQYALYLGLSIVGGLILCLFGYWITQKLI